MWSCDHRKNRVGTEEEEEEEGEEGRCGCVGKVCMVDVVCYLCREENLLCPSEALKVPVTEIISEAPPGIVVHLDPSSRYPSFFFCYGD